jgi:hypothetical protein
MNLLNMLGEGMAENAGKALKGREAKINSVVNQAVNGKPKPKAKVSEAQPPRNHDEFIALGQ